MNYYDVIILDGDIVPEDVDIPVKDVIHYDDDGNDFYADDDVYAADYAAAAEDDAADCDEDDNNYVDNDLYL